MLNIDNNIRYITRGKNRKAYLQKRRRIEVICLQAYWNHVYREKKNMHKQKRG